MSRLQEATAPTREDLTVATITYGLMLVSLLAFPPMAIVGVIMAHVSAETAGPVAGSHYRFQVRTFWIGLAAWLLSGVALFWGGLFSVILIGIPILVAAALSFGIVWLWALVRCAMGLAWTLQGNPCPRPESYAF